MKISVVVPTYKRPQLLLKCLRALLNQTFDKEAYEIIVVSDGPDEATAKVLEKWSDGKLRRLRYLIPHEKKGPAAARNYGWQSAEGNLIAFTDDDCVPDKNWLSSFYTQYLLNKGLAFTGKTIVPVSKKPTDYERNIMNLETADFITANCCCTKAALQLTGGFDEQFTMAWREDSDMEFKLLNAGISIFKVEGAVIIHPVRQAKWGVSIKEQKKTMFNALLYKKFPHLYRQKIQPTGPVHYYATIASFLMLIAGMVVHSQFIIGLGLVFWLGLTALFIYRRLRSTTLAFDHLIEMVVTSLFIPFLSVYWQLYGAIKYRVLFL